MNISKGLNPESTEQECLHTVSYPLLTGYLEVPPKKVYSLG